MRVTTAKPVATPPDLDVAVEVFVRGYSFTRSFTYPYHAERVDGVWVVRDGPRKNAADYRREEWVTLGDDAAGVHRVARRHTRGHYCVCAVRAAGEPDAPLRAAYKALGYRLGTTEPFMVHRLRRIPRLPEPFPVRRVRTPELADTLAKAVGSRQVLPAHFSDDSPLWQYAAMDGSRPIGWVRSIAVEVAGGMATWVSNMHVEAKYRRRGIGRSLLARMLRDDRARGASASYLLASHTGALLYGAVGYEQLGELLVYTPARRRP